MRLKYEPSIQIVVWGIGTALGELPPYLVSFSASVSGEKVLLPLHLTQLFDVVRRHNSFLPIEWLNRLLCGYQVWSRQVDIRLPGKGN